MLNASFVISAAHPGLPGHFPGNPVTPGVVALDYIAHSLIAQVPDTCLIGFPNVKYIKPLPPGVEVAVTYIDKGGCLFQFGCESDGEIILLGQIQLGRLRG